MIKYNTIKIKQKKPNDVVKMIKQLNNFKNHLGDNIYSDIAKNISKVGLYGFFYSNSYIQKSKYTLEVIKMYNGKKLSAGTFIGGLIKSIIHYSVNEVFILHHLKSERANVYFRIK